MNIKRATKDQKEYMAMAAILALHRKEQELLGHYHWVNASQVARQIGYKSGNSIRDTLYDLVDAGKIQMYTGDPARGPVPGPIWFRAELPAIKSKGK